MPRIAYFEPKLTPGSLAVVQQTNTIIAEYQALGFKLTLRQLYYQFVARDLLPNRVREYKRLGRIVNDGRLMGLIDWDAIEDRGRNLKRSPAWASPEAIVKACAEQFQLDPWEHQGERCEVWIEKEALIGVIEGVCLDLRVPHFACKGYVSQSEVWDAGRNRIRRYARGRKPTTIFHLGDHDPSGIDMTRDLSERLSLFAEAPVRIVRLALNFDQVEQYEPPPNPAKMTDSRFNGYADLYGDQSWELDALKPNLIADLIREHVEGLIDPALWQEAMDEEQTALTTLEAIAGHWDEVQEFLSNREEE